MKNTYLDFYATLLLTSGPTLWMMRSFLGIGALEVSSWLASVSVTMVVLSSSSRGLFDIEEVPGVAETKDEAWVLFRYLPDTESKLKK